MKSACRVPIRLSSLDDLQESIGYLLRSANQYAVGRFNNYMAEIHCVEVQLDQLIAGQKLNPLTGVAAFGDVNSLGPAGLEDTTKYWSYMSTIDKNIPQRVRLNPL